MTTRTVDSENVPACENYDVNMDAYAHVSHFGALKTSPVVPVLAGNFPGSSLDTNLWLKDVVSGGTVTVENGVGKLKTGTNSAGAVTLISRRTGRFEAGQVTVFQSGVYPGAGLANNTRRWGVMDREAQNGLFFELDGTTFNVVARAGGSDTEVAAASFNVDTTFSPSAANNTYRIFYSAGRALFCAASAGKLRVLHRLTDSDLPLVEDLDLGMYYENTNSGSVTDTEMRLRGASLSVFGCLERYNKGRALVTVDHYDEVALGHVSGEKMVTKFGRNPDVDSGPEDVYAAGSEYTGFDATGNENLQALSASANDVGSLVDSGTSTAGDDTTLTDSGATFVTTGVAAGDILVNDTIGAHGVILSLTETVLTVHQMEGDDAEPMRNATGDTYRIVSTSGTGAALVRANMILDEDYEEQLAQYFVMNGASTVDRTVNAMRCSRAQVILAGSGGTAAGDILLRQATSTSNVFAYILAGQDQTTQAVYTVPAGKKALLKRVRTSIARASGAAGSAVMTLRVRRRGEVFRAARVFDVQTGGGAEFRNVGGDVFPPACDIKFRVDSVSDTNTFAEAAFELDVMSNAP